jgi:hypothetical protein
MKVIFLSITVGILTFFLWSALKPSKRPVDILRQSWHQTGKSPDSTDDPNLPPLRDPWDRKWQI